MARTITEIQAQIVAAVLSNSVLSTQLTNTSATAIWRLWTYIVATATWSLEVLFDAFKLEASNIVNNQKAHTLPWYQYKATNFQFGGTLAAGQDYYDNTGLSDDTILAQKVVAQAAVVEQDNLLIVKAARDVSGTLEPLTLAQIASLEAYITEIKDAGVKCIIRSVNADHLVCDLDIYFDPLVLGATGERLDGTSSTPVQDAAKAFLRLNPFDGQFVVAHFIDALQAVDGVVVPDIKGCQARRDDDPSFGAISVFYKPYSGFLKFYSPSDLVLTFKSY